MKQFLFIVPLTPERLITPLRKELFNCFINALKRIDYKNWSALLIGEKDFEDGNIKYIKIGAESKELKLVFAREYLKNLDKKPDFVIRMDDDDILNPNCLNAIASLNFDCYADKYHAFYDVCSGKISQQHRAWFANTVIHKFEHAMKEVGEDGMTILQADHSKAWNEYYKNKKVVYAAKNAPLYLRVLSPTTVTSHLHGQNGTVHEQYTKFKVATIENQLYNPSSVKRHESYLKGFGKWDKKVLPDFTFALKDLENVKTMLNWPSKGIKEYLNKLKNKILLF